LSPAKLSKWYARATFQLFCLYSVWSHRDLSLAPYSSSCIRQKSAESLLSMGSSSTSMQTTAKFTSTSANASHGAIDQLSRCLHDVDVWKSASRLRLNASKTQVLWLGSRLNIDRLTVREVPVLWSTVGVVGSACNLGVVIDSRLSMADHVASVFLSAYYYLRQIRPTLQSLSRDAVKTLIQAFISSRLDYCNSVLYRVTDNLLQRLQSVQNAAARLMTRTGRRRREHISPVLFCRNCTGCLFDAAWISNWQHQSSSSIEY